MDEKSEDWYAALAKTAAHLKRTNIALAKYRGRKLTDDLAEEIQAAFPKHQLRLINYGAAHTQDSRTDRITVREDAFGLVESAIVV